MERRAARLAHVLLIFVASAACAQSVEEQTLLRFFEAARMLDSVLIAKYATVGFNPRTDGVVQSFTVTDVGPERDARKDVTIDAVVLDAGGTTTRALRVAFQKIDGRWIITSLQRIPASRTSRATSSGQPS